MELAWGMGLSPRGGQIENGLAHVGEGNLLLHGAKFESGARHAVDDAALDLLANDVRVDHRPQVRGDGDLVHADVFALHRDLGHQRRG